MKKILVALILCTSTIVFAQEKVLLRVNQEVGDTYDVKMRMTQDMGDLMKMEIGMDMTIEVTDLKNGNTISEAQFSRATMAMDYLGQSMEYDSNMEESEMDEFGKGAHAEMKKLLESVMLIENDNLGNVIKTEIKSGNADISAFKDNMSGMIYPEEAVGVGSTWTATKQQQDMRIESTYEVVAITDDTVTVKITGEMIGVEGTLKGQSFIDRATGNVTKSEVAMTFEVEGQTVESNVVLTSTKK